MSTLIFFGRVTSPSAKPPFLEDQFLSLSLASLLLCIHWEHNIKICLQEIGWEDVVWINVAEVRDEWYAVVRMVSSLEVS
jgi:hypothetical protein